MSNISLDIHQLILETAATEVDKKNIVLKFLKIDETKITNKKTFFEQFNLVLNPPKKFKDFDDFELRMMNIDWLPERSVLSYKDPQAFKYKDPENFEMSRTVCKKIANNYGAFNPKNLFKLKRDFVFNYNGLHFRDAAISGAISGASAGIIMYNLSSGNWDLSNLF